MTEDAVESKTSPDNMINRQVTTQLENKTSPDNIINRQAQPGKKINVILFFPELLYY